MSDDLDKLDLYGIFEVNEDAGEKEILKAYRKKALRCHPDKNPDNPKAVEEFHLLARALEVLTDKAARLAYDKVVKARLAAAERHKLLDDRRKKFKEDLESKEKRLAEREAEAEKKSASSKASANLAAEVDRLKKEGGSLLLQEQERLVREMMKESTTTTMTEGVGRTLKVRWKVCASSKSDYDSHDDDDGGGGGYSEARLTKIFSKYGVVKTVVVSSAAAAKKKGSALVEFESAVAANLAKDLELGLPRNPLKISSLDEAASATKKTTTKSLPTAEVRDFESLVMRKMRQAEERKRLVEQMQNEDGL